jgi:hypothetical protein
MKHSNGNIYTGALRRSAKHGQGRMVWASGDVYEGEWADGLIHGRGVFKYSDKGEYDGVDTSALPSSAPAALSPISSYPALFYLYSPLSTRLLLDCSIRTHATTFFPSRACAADGCVGCRAVGAGQEAWAGPHDAPQRYPPCPASPNHSAAILLSPAADPCHAHCTRPAPWRARHLPVRTAPRICGPLPLDNPAPRLKASNSESGMMKSD